jgi:hypothetical protein
LKTQKGLADPDYSVQLRIQSELEEISHASFRCNAEAAHTPAPTVFYILTKVLSLRFRHWQCVPHLLSEDQKADRARRALMLLAALMAAEKGRRLDVWNCDEFWIMWVNPHAGSWMAIDEELS